jgi:hypothetical protein
MSYTDPAWIKADPDYWKPMAAPVAKAAAKDTKANP